MKKSAWRKYQVIWVAHIVRNLALKLAYQVWYGTLSIPDTLYMIKRRSGPDAL